MYSIMVVEHLLGREGRKREWAGCTKTETPDRCIFTLCLASANRTQKTSCICGNVYAPICAHVRTYMYYDTCATARYTCVV